MKRNKKYIYIVVERGTEISRDTASYYIVCGTRLSADMNCKNNERVLRYELVTRNIRR